MKLIIENQVAVFVGLCRAESTLKYQKSLFCTPILLLLERKRGSIVS